MSNLPITFWQIVILLGHANQYLPRIGEICIFIYTWLNTMGILLKGYKSTPID